jgi:hypothetical protein
MMPYDSASIYARGDFFTIYISRQSIFFNAAIRTTRCSRAWIKRMVHQQRMHAYTRSCERVIIAKTIYVISSL